MYSPVMVLKWAMDPYVHGLKWAWCHESTDSNVAVLNEVRTQMDTVSRTQKSQHP